MGMCVHVPHVWMYVHPLYAFVYNTSMLILLLRDLAERFRPRSALSVPSRRSPPSPPSWKPTARPIVMPATLPTVFVPPSLPRPSQHRPRGSQPSVRPWPVCGAPTLTHESRGAWRLTPLRVLASRPGSARAVQLPFIPAAGATPFWDCPART